MTNVWELYHLFVANIINCGQKRQELMLNKCSNAAGCLFNKVSPESLESLSCVSKEMLLPQLLGLNALICVNWWQIIVSIKQQNNKKGGLRSSSRIVTSLHNGTAAAATWQEDGCSSSRVDSLNAKNKLPKHDYSEIWPSGAKASVI